MTAYRKIQAVKLSTDFRDATRIVSVPAEPLGSGMARIKVHFVGVNASDINFTKGAYLPGVKPPFDVGFEGIGEIIELGSGCDGLKEHQPVMFTPGASNKGAFTECITLPANTLVPVPAIDPKYLTALVSGLTASIALEEVGQLSENETVLVTAAAGGTGLYAVQLAALKGNHVIGTCSSDSKVETLKQLGCHRVINYKKEDLHQVLKKEYPKGINLVYESVGGGVFDACVANLAVHGRLIVIGAISGYKDSSAFVQSGANTKAPLPTQLLAKSASVRGFFLMQFRNLFPLHLMKLSQLLQGGKLRGVVDEKRFVGLASIADAIDHLYSGNNVGKVVVSLQTSRL